MNWKKIDAFPKYSVSDAGEVRNDKTGRILRLAKMSDGYLGVCLLGEKQRTMSVHRLVATAFIPNPDNKRDINHINGDKMDNRAENLEWCTHAENVRHAVAVLGASHKKKERTGILCVETGVVYPSAKAAGDAVHRSDMMIRKCLYGKSRTAAGYHWKYVI